MITKEKRPRLKIEPTLSDKLLEVIGWCALVAMWALILLTYEKLPEIIPTHYNSNGIIDGYGNKSSIWILPIVASALFIGMTFLNMFPHIFNYLTTITEENALRQYAIATRMMRYVKLALVIVIGYLVSKTIYIANVAEGGLGSYFTPLMFGVIFIPIAYYLFAMIRNR